MLPTSKVESTLRSIREGSEDEHRYKRSVVHNFEQQIQILTPHRQSTPSVLCGDRSAATAPVAMQDDASNKPNNPSDNAGNTLLHDACKDQSTVQAALVLLDLGADPVARNFDGETPMHCVSATAHAEIVEILQRRGADVNARNMCGETPLHAAVRRGNFAVNRALLRAGACATLRDNKGRSALDLACMRQREDIVRMMVNTFAVNVTSTNAEGVCALHVAEGEGVVHTLVDAGANVSVRDNIGRTPLHLVCGRKESTLRALLDRGADINASDFCLNTPLHVQVVRGGHGVGGHTLFLLSKGADVHAQNNTGKTPLHIAIKKGRVALTRLLLDAGAKPDTRSHGGIGSMIVAAAHNRPRLVHILKKFGGNVDAADNIGQTPLHYAVFKGLGEVAAALLRAGANPFLRTHRGRSALDIAVVHGRNAIVDQMMDVTNTDLDGHLGRGDNIGQTPLHHACRNSALKITKLLLGAGADPTARDNCDMSPLDVAVVNGQVFVVNLLVESGMDVQGADRQGWTALHYSAKKGFLQVSRALMDAGADASERNVNQVSPLDVAVGEGHTHLVSNMVRKHGADATLVDTNGFTALHLAETKDMVDVLVAAGADVNVRNYEGNTPLMYQIIEPQLVAALLHHGALVNTQNETGQTVLHMAVRNGREQTTVEIVDMLLRAGADETLLDCDGYDVEDLLDLNTPFALEALELIRSAPRDRAWRRRGNFIMSVEFGWSSTLSIVNTRSRHGRHRFVEWLRNTRDSKEGVFRNIVAYL